MVSRAQFGKTHTREFFKDFKLHSYFAFEKPTLAGFFQIELETILLPIQIRLFLISYSSGVHSCK